MLLLVVLGWLVASPAKAQEPAPLPTPTAPGSVSQTNTPPSDSDDLPRFVINSPFSDEYHSPVPRDQKRLWATSRLWKKAPELVVEEWLTPKPDCQGKFLLIEFWATWCGPCRRTIPELNAFQHQFKDDLVVIGISEEDARTVGAFKQPPMEYAIAVDTQARMKKELGVIGIPHVIVVEPGGHVVWEGFPLLQGHELTADVLARIIEAGRKGGSSSGDPAERLVTEQQTKEKN